MDIYRDPLFWLFPVASVSLSLGAFLFFAVPMTAVAKWDPEWLRHRRIQGSRGRPEKWIWPSVWHTLRNNAIMAALVVVAWPLLWWSRVHAGPLPPWWEVAGSLVVFVYVDDFLYYLMHRSLHQKWLYRHVHKVHHRVTTPWAIAGNYMHPIEFVGTGILVLLGPLLLGSHVVTVWVWVVFRQFEAAEGHCGYELPFNPRNLFPGHTSPRFHDVHHMKFNGNYSGFLGYIDRLSDTIIPGTLPEEGGRRSG